jgi:hypothetical protein
MILLSTSSLLTNSVRITTGSVIFLFLHISFINLVFAQQQHVYGFEDLKFSNGLQKNSDNPLSNPPPLSTRVVQNVETRSPHWLNTSLSNHTINLSRSEGWSEDPQIIAEGRYVYLIWLDYSSKNRDIYFKRSIDNGQTFGSVTNISNQSGASLDPEIAISGNNIYIIWEHAPGNNGQIYFARSTDNGATFERSIYLANNTGLQGFPQIAAAGSHVFAVWHDASNGIKFARSTDNGASFEEAIELDEGTDTLEGNTEGTDYSSFNPQIVTRADDVFVVWISRSHDTKEVEPESQDVVFRRSTDNGATFEGIINLSKDNDMSANIRIEAAPGEGNNIYIAWQNATKLVGDRLPDFLTDVVFRRSTDNGATFEGIINLSNNTGWSAKPQIAVSDNDNIYAVWEDNPQGTNGEIMFRRSTDNGATFEGITKLNGESMSSYSPQIAVSDNDNIYAVWEDNPQGTNGEIMFRRSTDNGATFDSIINLSNNTGSSAKPQIAVSDNDNIYAVWQNQSAEGSGISLVDNSAGKDIPFSYENNLGTPESFVDTDAQSLDIAIVDPVFTESAYNNSFYVFYNMAIHLAGVETDRDIPSDISISKYTNLLSSKVSDKKSGEENEQPLSLATRIKWLIPESNTVILTDTQVDEGALSFQNGTNKYDFVILGHQEYVTQREYYNLKRFVANGGVMILLDGNVFYAEVKYDQEEERITLVKGHRWEFDGNFARRSVEERWEKETSEWVGSNYLCCYGYKIRFANNPFDYIHNEEQHVTNPDATVLLDYNATDLEDRYKFDPKVATYLLDYKKGMTIALGLYSDDILSNDRFQRFFDSLLLEYGRDIRN